MTISAGSGTSNGGGIISLTSGASDTGSYGAASLKSADAAGSGASSSNGDLDLAKGSTYLSHLWRCDDW